MSAGLPLALLAILALVVIWFGLRRALTPDMHRVDERIRRYAGRRALTAEEQRQAASVQVTQMLAQRVEASISGRSFAGRLQTELTRANLKLTVAEFLIFQTSMAITAGAAAFLLARSPLAGFGFAILGWFGPRLWVARRQMARLKAFNEQLPDTVALLSNSLRSGLSLVQAMEMIARESEPPIAEEFHRVTREIGLGVGPQDALLHLVRRMSSEDLDLLVTAILVQFEVGGNLSKILDSIVHTIRERIKLQGEIRTMSAQGRSAGWILAGLPIAVAAIMLLIAPGYIGLLFTPGPWIALPVLALLGIAMGTFVIRRMVAIEV